MQRTFKLLFASFRFTHASLIPLLIGGLSVVVFLVVFLLPVYARINALDWDIRLRQEALDRQELLAPIHARLTVQLREASAAVLEQQAALPQPGNPEDLAPALRILADRAEMSALSVTPNASSLTAQDGLSVELHLAGPFPRLRNLLMALLAQSWITRLERLEISDGGDMEEFRVWVGVIMDKRG